MKIFFSCSLLLCLLSGCASNLHIVTSKSSKSQESRVQFLILHYTALDLPNSLKVLTEQEVSSHYLVADDEQNTIYRLVDENRLAYHAGLSYWKGNSRLNASSIGIEIVNLGYQETPAGRVYPPFPEKQIDSVMQLIRDIVARHKIRPENILGHSEIAPQRKPDPGPLFPWRRLAAAGLIPWPEAKQVELKQLIFEQQLPELAWFQLRLLQHGYATPQNGLLDEETQNVLIAFQTRYRPEKFDGIPDAETAALLDVITNNELHE
jgi:N-acetylmuramoyl-L-alanine amidase